MFEIQRILAATDFSRNAELAASRAAVLCKELQLDALELLTVSSRGWGEVLAQSLKRTRADPDVELMSRALRDLRKMEQRLKSEHGVRCRFSARLGDTVTELLAASEARSVDMVVIGNPSGNFFEKLVGTTADKLIRLSRHPVLLVRNAPVHGYREVLVPVDFSLESRHAARLALKIAPKAHIVFLHAFRVWPEGKMREAGVYDDIINSYRTKYREQAKQELNQFIEDLGPIAQEITRVVEFGWAVPVITSYEGKMAPDLIVMGRHSNSRLQDFLIGSVARRTVDQSTSDVLIAPRPGRHNDAEHVRPAA